MARGWPRWAGRCGPVEARSPTVAGWSRVGRGGPGRLGGGGGENGRAWDSGRRGPGDPGAGGFKASFSFFREEREEIRRSSHSPWWFRRNRAGKTLHPPWTRQPHALQAVRPSSRFSSRSSRPRSHGSDLRHPDTRDPPSRPSTAVRCSLLVAAHRQGGAENGSAWDSDRRGAPDHRDGTCSKSPGVSITVSLSGVSMHDDAAVGTAAR